MYAVGKLIARQDSPVVVQRNISEENAFGSTLEPSSDKKLSSVFIANLRLFPLKSRLLYKTILAFVANKSTINFKEILMKLI